MPNAEDALPVELEDRRKSSDRRIAPRKRIRRSGKTFWPNGDSSECVIVNYSETGAKLELLGPAPNKFDLVMDGNPQRLACSVVWRQTNMVGVKFEMPSRFERKGRGLTQRAAAFKHYTQVCQDLAAHATPSDREILLEMASAWTKVLRRRRSEAS
jgi:hypothetical protein